MIWLIIKYGSLNYNKFLINKLTKLLIDFYRRFHKIFLRKELWYEGYFIDLRRFLVRWQGRFWWGQVLHGEQRQIQFSQERSFGLSRDFRTGSWLQLATMCYSRLIFRQTQWILVNQFNHCHQCQRFRTIVLHTP